MLETPREQRDRDWVESIGSGDHDAFEMLFQTYVEELCVFAAQHVGDSEAEDIVQTVFCDLWNRRREWAPRGTVKAYLFRAVRNTALDRLDRRRVRLDYRDKEKNQDRGSGRVGPQDHLQYVELERAMQRAVDNLPERRRLVYVMAHRHDMTYKEIAIALDIAPKTVENQVGRALKSLREHLVRFATFIL
jgi:RNA polymerase sigma-70 factor (ECF subfamily)